MRIAASEAILVLVDVQERLFPHMAEREMLERTLPILLAGLRVLEVPLLVTQQYTRGLGPTIPLLQEAVGPQEIIEKIAFSCCDEERFAARLAAAGRRQVILAGIEAHVCVLQTAVDLAALGYRPVVAADCVSSRRTQDKEVALERMRSEGATVTTSESLLFELCRYAGSDTFRAISRLVK